MVNFIWGTKKKDVLHGTDEGDVIQGFDRDDLLYGYQGRGWNAWPCPETSQALEVSALACGLPDPQGAHHLHCPVSGWRRM